MTNTHPILLYTESDKGRRPSTMVGTVSADDKGRLVFRNNDNSVTMVFIDIEDSGALSDALSKSNIKFTRPEGDKTLFDV